MGLPASLALLLSALPACRRQRGSAQAMQCLDYFWTGKRQLFRTTPVDLQRRDCIKPVELCEPPWNISGCGRQLAGLL
jgi:hypothetical protein